MSVEKHISHLLFEHDCVIIPQFGGFVGNYKSAKLDRIQNKFTPPSKEISFNRNLIHNDGLLANRIVVAEKKSYDEATVFLKKYSEDLKTALGKGEKLEFPQIGILYADAHRNIQFDPDNSTNFLMDSFGLSEIYERRIVTANPPKQINEKQISPKSRDEKKIAPPEIKENRNVETAEKKPEVSLREKTVPLKFSDRNPIAIGSKPDSYRVENRKLPVRKYLKYAAVLPLLALLLWIPFNLEKIKTVGQKASSINYSNLIPFTEKPVSVYSERKSLEKVSGVEFEKVHGSPLPDSASFTVLSFYEEGEEEFSEAKKIVVAPKEFSLPPTENQKPKTKNHFHIIAGCFEYIENAEKLVAQLRKKGFDSTIIDRHNGLHRVAFQSFHSRNKALDILAQVKSAHNSDAWLLVK